MGESHQEQILRVLFDLHGSLVKKTIDMKDPSDLSELLNKFSDLSSEINDYLEGSPISTNSQELTTLFTTIGDPSQLSPEVKAVCQNWTIMMFETYPTVITPDHFHNLAQNAATLSDGSSEAEPEDTEEDM